LRHGKIVGHGIFSFLAMLRQSLGTFPLEKSLFLFFYGPAAGYLSMVFWSTVLVQFAVLIPISFIANLKKMVSVIFVYVGILYAILSCIWGFITTYMYWGKIGVNIGFWFGGIGLIPVGFLAAATHGQWLSAGFIAFGTLLVYMTFTISAKLDEDYYSKYR